MEGKYLYHRTEKTKICCIRSPSEEETEWMSKRTEMENMSHDLNLTLLEHQFRIDKNNFFRNYINICHEYLKQKFIGNANCMLWCWKYLFNRMMLTCMTFLKQVFETIDVGDLDEAVYE